MTHHNDPPSTPSEVTRRIPQHTSPAARKALSLADLGARLRADMAELTSLRAALDCAVPQYQGDAMQQMGYLIALAHPERRAPATADTVRPPPEPRP